MSQTIDLVVTIRNLAESSKSELSSVTFGHFKVYKKEPTAKRANYFENPLHAVTRATIFVPGDCAPFSRAWDGLPDIFDISVESSISAKC